MKKKWQTILAASLAGVLLWGSGQTAGYAAYALNSEVKSATPSLRQAAQIGVLVSENPELAEQENKDAIVVMSFGTTYKETRQATIEKTVEEIRAAHPDTKVVTAFTSHIIIERIEKKEGIHYPTPEEALEELRTEGYTRVALTTLDIIPGMEYAYDTAVFNNYKDQFKKMTMGTPLMYWMGQVEQRDDILESMKALATEFPAMGKADAVLVMAHGTPHPSNAYYSVMQNRLQQLGLDNVYIYSVEGWPHLDTVIPALKAKGIKNVTLVPMMMVAGDHANNDMAGSEPDSHKSILEREGFTVTPYIHGLGENEAVRQLFVERANEAWEALQTEK